LSFATLAVLTTRPPCRPSLASCLLSLEESLLSVPDAYGQSLAAFPSQPAASRTGTRVHILAHGVYETHNGPPDSILSDEPKPLGKHRPPPQQ
ncbi:hypothetical protein Tco_0248778, partial [Tanacetum coccineum]